MQNFLLSPYVRLRHCVGVITFVVFLVTHAMLVIQRSSLDSYLWTRSSWFAGKIKDFQGLNMFVGFFFRVQLPNSLLLWLTLIVLSRWCLVYLYSEPLHNLTRVSKIHPMRTPTLGILHWAVATTCLN